MRTVILTSPEARIEGYAITAYKGIVQGESWNELLRHAEELGANAILNTRFDNALDVDTLFHGTGVVVEPLKLPIAPRLSRAKPKIQIAGQLRRIQ